VTANETCDPSMPYNEMTQATTMPFIKVMMSENTFIASNMPFAMPHDFPNMPVVIDGLADVLIAGDPPFGKNHELFLEEDEKKPRPEPEPPPTGSWYPTSTWSLRQRLVAYFFGGSSFTVQDFYGPLTFPEVNLPMSLFFSLFLLRKMGSVRKLAGFGMPPNASKWKHSGSLETSPTDANICAIGTLLGSNKWTMWTGFPVPSHVEAWKDPCPPWPHKY